MCAPGVGSSWFPSTLNLDYLDKLPNNAVHIHTRLVTAVLVLIEPIRLWGFVTGKRKVQSKRSRTHRIRTTSDHNPCTR
jgi:hypothetical protein